MWWGGDKKGEGGDKSGHTPGNVVACLEELVFIHGQLYVASSRVGKLLFST